MNERKKVFALCYPGNDFNYVVVSHLMQLQAYLLGEGYEVAGVPCYTNNIYITRAKILEAMVKAPMAIDYILWLDDDNPMTVPQLVKLIDDLDAHPEADLVSGWYWNAGEVFEGVKVSVGHFTGPDNIMVHVLAKDIAGKKRLMPVDWVSFGAVLMRMSAIEKVGDRPFRPILNDAWELGFSGDDISFSLRLFQAGGIQLVDPEVHVPHLKVRAVSPPVQQIPQDAKQPAAPGNNAAAA